MLRFPSKHWHLYLSQFQRFIFRVYLFYLTYLFPLTVSLGLIYFRPTIVSRDPLWYFHMYVLVQVVT